MSLVTEQMMLSTVVAKHDIKQMSFIGISIQIQLAMVGSVALFYSLPNFPALAVIFVLCNSKKVYTLVSQMVCLCSSHAQMNSQVWHLIIVVVWAKVPGLEVQVWFKH